MSSDTNVRDFLQSMADEIDVSPLETKAPVRRARRHRRVTLAVVAVIAVVVVSGASVGWRSFSATPRPADDPHLSTPTMHNGSIGVFGYMNGVRTLTSTGAGAFVYACRGTCTHVAADWSPDGIHLAFATTCGPNCTTADDPYNGIHVVDVGIGLDQLVVPGNGVGEPAWSPDGQRIAYVDPVGDGPSAQIVVTNRDGSGRALVASLLSEAWGLSWSPDGSRIAYVQDERLFVVGLDGSAPTPLGVDSRDPTWSPDGTMIAYFNGNMGAHGCEIRETTPNGSTDFSLIDLAAVSDRCDYGGDLEWSPDGTQLAALAFEELDARKGSTAVFVMNADGSGARPYADWRPGWPWDGITWQPVR